MKKLFYLLSIGGMLAACNSGSSGSSSSPQVYSYSYSYESSSMQVNRIASGCNNYASGTNFNSWSQINVYFPQVSPNAYIEFVGIDASKFAVEAAGQCGIPGIIGITSNNPGCFISITGGNTSESITVNYRLNSQYGSSEFLGNFQIPKCN